MLRQDDRAAQIARLENMSEEEIHQNALADPDCPPLTDEQLAEFVPIRDVATLIMEKRKNIWGGKILSISIHYETPPRSITPASVLSGRMASSYGSFHQNRKDMDLQNSACSSERIMLSCVIGSLFFS